MTLTVSYTIFNSVIVKDNRGGVESFYMADTTTKIPSQCRFFSKETCVDLKLGLMDHLQLFHCPSLLVRLMSM